MKQHRNTNTMTRKRMRSLPTFRLAAWQCLALSLLLSTVPNACAWIQASVKTKRRATGWHSKPVDGKWRRTSQTPTSLGVGEGVIDFVNGPDYSALGNHMASQALVASSSIMAADESVTMNISNGAVLAGGAVATLSFLSLAGYFMYQSQAEGGNANQAFSSSSVGGIEEVMPPMPKRGGNENSLSEQLEAAQTRFQEQQQPPQPVSPPSPPKVAESSPESDSTAQKVAEAQKLAAQKVVEAQKLTAQKVAEAQKLAAQKADEAQKLAAQKADEAQKLAAQEKAVEAQKLAAQKAAEAENLKESESNLTEKLKDAESKLAAETKLREEAVKREEEAVKREKVQIKLREELTELKGTLEGELKQVAETVRVLEDEYELEQNKSSKDNTELEDTQERLTRTQAELSRIHGEFLTTIKLLSKTSGALEDLEEEQRSFRNLGKKMWRLSKSRVSHRITFVGDFLRGRKKIKKKSKKRA